MKCAQILGLLMTSLMTRGASPHGLESGHWSLQPLVRPEVPANPFPELRPKNPVDSFVWRRLAEVGLRPSGRASAAGLQRRLSYVLTGLPPRSKGGAAEEMEYPLLVNRLLSAPEYGECWARHWLDVVRFAETHGFEMNQPRNNAWRYRDYVIQAFNRDEPYDQFVREQIAGDVLGAGDATGFLVGGPWDQVKSPDPVLTANQRADELHDMISVTAATFLGMTVGCARCHDHKFDPIPQTDYYAMSAVFAGVEHGERARKDADAERSRERLAELRKRIERLDSELEALEPLADPNRRQAARSAVSARQNIEKIRLVEARKLRFTVRKTSGAEPCIDELEVFTPEGKNVALASEGTKALASGTYPNSEFHKLEHINDGRYGNSRSWISDEAGKGWVELDFPESVRIAKIVWGRDREEKYKDRLALDYSIEVAGEEGEWQTVASSSDRQQADGERVAGTPEIADLLARRKASMSDAESLEKTLMVYAGRFEGEPKPTHRLRRGDPMQPQEVVEPGALSAVGLPLPDECCAAEWTSDQTRRVAFAEWLTNPKNPLPARVMVNRIWQYDFGAGLVTTPSDFGVNGARPSHPDLLDWLASEFIQSGWSVKHIQRLILGSATFQQESAARAEAMAVDAGTWLLWRFPPRRLEAEAIRDSILAAGGKLDSRMGGPGFSFFEPNENYVRVYVPREAWPDETFRRMVYGTVVRQRPDGVFGAFDCPDAGQIAPKRTSSTTPLQALNLLNSSFVMQQADFFARRLESETAEVPEQVRRGFLLAFQRAPNAEELDAAESLARREGLEVFCRALFNANEFVYLF